MSQLQNGRVKSGFVQTKWVASRAMSCSADVQRVTAVRIVEDREVMSDGTDPENTGWREHGMGVGGEGVVSGQIRQVVDVLGGHADHDGTDPVIVCHAFGAVVAHDHRQRVVAALQQGARDCGASTRWPGRSPSAREVSSRVRVSAVRCRRDRLRRRSRGGWRSVSPGSTGSSGPAPGLSYRSVSSLRSRPVFARAFLRFRIRGRRRFRQDDAAPRRLAGGPLGIH